MLRRLDPRRIERFLAVDDVVVAAVPASPQGALPDTVGAIVARSLGLAQSASAAGRRWDSTNAVFVADAAPIDLRSWRQVVLAVTGKSNRLVIIGVDRIGRPIEALWSTEIGALAGAKIEPARLSGVATDALVISAPRVGALRFVLARPHRRAGRDLAARLSAEVRYFQG